MRINAQKVDVCHLNLSKTIISPASNYGILEQKRRLFFLRGIYEFASTETWKSTDPPTQVYPPRPTISSSPSIAYNVEAPRFQGRAFFRGVPGTRSLRGT